MKQLIAPAVVSLLFFHAAFSQTANDWINTGNNRYNKDQDYRGAVDAYNEAIRLDPTSALAFKNRGNAHYLLGKYTAAVDDHSEAIRLNPTYTDAYNDRGRAKLALKDYEGALLDFKEIIFRLDPKFKFAYYNRARTYFAMEKYEETIDDLSEAIRIDPKYIAAYSMRATVKRKLGRMEEAMQDNDEILRISPTAGNYNSHGYVNMGLGRYEEALADFNEALKLNPNPNFFDSRGEAYMNLGKYDLAINDYTEAILQSPKFVHAFLYRGMTYARSGNLAQATSDYNKAVELNGDGKLYMDDFQKLRSIIEQPDPKKEVVIKSEVSGTAEETYVKRLALVIGNSQYQHGGVLPNPVNDSRAMAGAMKSLGFTVMEYENVNQNQLKQAIRDFGDKLKGFDMGLFYYAGHGIQNKGRNYMIPVEADIKSETEIEYNCVEADRVLSFMEVASAKVNVIIMDACRNNPFERSWNRSSASGGLALMDAPKGSIIAYATSPGKVASDGSEKNGLYTSAILKYIYDQNLTLEQVFKKVRADVESKSSGGQVPWETTSLTGADFYFNAKQRVNSSTSAPVQTQSNVLTAVPVAIQEVKEIPRDISNEKTTTPLDADGLFNRGMENYKSVNYSMAFKDFEAAAQLGDARAQYWAGYLAMRGLGTPVNLSKAFQWFRKASDGGNSSASVQLGDCYRDGLGCPADKAKAAELYKKAGESGNGLGFFNLGFAFGRGDGVPKDAAQRDKYYAQALQLFNERAPTGDAESQFGLGLCYSGGYGTPKDQAKAEEWLQKAADQGMPNAMMSLAGIEYQAKNYTQAIRWYTKAANQGNASAQQALGGLYTSGTGVDKNETLGSDWYRKAFETNQVAANQESVTALRSVAFAYSLGQGVAKDQVRASELFQKLADQNDATSTYMLGNNYYYGTGIAKDLVKAARYYQKATDLGDRSALMQLGNCYMKGEGVVKDEEKGFLIYKNAAEQDGFVGGWTMDKLADCYYNGTGTSRNYAQAVFWYRKAAEGQYPWDWSAYKLGKCYEEGKGVKRDKDQARYWYQRAGDRVAEAKEALKRL